MQNPMRIFRHAVLNGQIPPTIAVMALVAQGIDVAELEQRLLLHRARPT